MRNKKNRVVVTESRAVDIGQVWHVNRARGNGSEFVVIAIRDDVVFSEYILIDGKEPYRATWGKSGIAAFNGARGGYGYLRDETEEWYLTRAKREYHEKLLNEVSQFLEEEF